MKFTLQITGSAAALAAAMRAVEDVDGEQAGNSTTSTNTGIGTPVAPVMAPSAPIVAVPIPAAPSPNTTPPVTASQEADDEDEGDDTDGSGLDADGLPWDERIHSSSKKRGKDGTWNKRRGGPTGDERKAIEDALRASVAPPVVEPAPLAPVALAAPPAPTTPTPVATPPLPPVEQAAEPPAIPAMPAPVAPVAPPVVEQPVQPAPVTAASAEMDFGALMMHVGPKLGEGEGQIGQAYVAAICQLHGLNQFTDLSLQTEKIPAIVAQLQADGRW